MKIYSKFIALTALLILGGCSGKTTSSSAISSSKQDVSNGSSSEKEVTYGEQTFNFANTSKAVKISEGHEEEFKAMFSDSSFLKLETYDLGGYVGFDLGGVKLGSAKEVGKLTLNFNYEVSEIIFSVSPYYKEYDGQINYDDTKIVVNGSSCEVEKVNYPTSVTYDTITDDNYSKNIVIENEAGGTTTSSRLIIYAMIVTYIIA